MQSSTGQGLGKAAIEYLESESRLVRHGLEGDLLPRVLNAAWLASPEFEAFRSKYSTAWSDDLIQGLAFNLVTFPGSTGLQKLVDVLEGADFRPLDAAVIGPRLAQLSRHPLSVLNLSRHLRTATNFVLRTMLMNPDGSDLQTTSLNIDPELLLLQEKGLKIRHSSVSKTAGLTDWLTALENVMYSLALHEREIRAKMGSSRTLAGGDATTKALAATYVRRFARVIGTAFELNEIPPFFDRKKDLSLVEEFTRLDKHYSGSYRDIQAKLEVDFVAKAPRIKSNLAGTPSRTEKSKTQFSTMKLDLNGRLLEIRTSGGEIGPSLIELALRAIALQQSIGFTDNHLDVFVESDGQALGIRLPQPVQSDLTKLRKVLTSLT